MGQMSISANIFALKSCLLWSKLCSKTWYHWVDLAYIDILWIFKIFSNACSSLAGYNKCNASAIAQAQSSNIEFSKYFWGRSLKTFSNGYSSLAGYNIFNTSAIIPKENYLKALIKKMFYSLDSKVKDSWG